MTENAWFFALGLKHNFKWSIGDPQWLARIGDHVSDYPLSYRVIGPITRSSRSDYPAKWGGNRTDYPP